MTCFAAAKALRGDRRHGPRVFEALRCQHGAWCDVHQLVVQELLQVDRRVQKAGPVRHPSRGWVAETLSAVSASCSCTHCGKAGGCTETVLGPRRCGFGLWPAFQLPPDIVEVGARGVLL